MINMRDDFGCLWTPKHPLKQTVLPPLLSSLAPYLLRSLSLPLSLPFCPVSCTRVSLISLPFLLSPSLFLFCPPPSPSVSLSLSLSHTFPLSLPLSTSLSHTTHPKHPPYSWRWKESLVTVIIDDHMMIVRDSKLYKSINKEQGNNSSSRFTIFILTTKYETIMKHYKEETSIITSFPGRIRVNPSQLDKDLGYNCCSLELA